jgi:hypothetical protein
MNFLIAAIIFALSPLITFAGHCRATGYPNPIAKTLDVCTIPEFLLALVDLVFLVGVPIVILFIIYAGYLFVVAGDNESRISRAKFVLQWCLIGATVLLSSKAIALTIQKTVISL